MFIDAADDERAKAEGGCTGGASIGKGSLILEDLNQALSQIPPDAWKVRKDSLLMDV